MSIDSWVYHTRDLTLGEWADWFDVVQHRNPKALIRFISARTDQPLTTVRALQGHEVEVVVERIVTALQQTDILQAIQRQIDALGPSV